MCKRILILLFLSLSFYSANSVSAAGCRENPAYRTLDFWIGDWNVYVGNDLVGANRIEAVLDSCAVIENWKEPDGEEGKSLFYFYPVTGAWKQVWVTDTGYVKEKMLVFANAQGVRFQGKVQSRAGDMILDRTTLTPASDGSVRQLIEQSEDDGKTWIPVFDAIYKRKQ